MDSVLYCSGITKTYGKKIALEDVNLDVPKGSIVGLLGPNGSGKTTLLKIAAGLLTPTKGEIKICGLEPGAKSKNLLAYQPDKVYLNDWMNVADLFKMMEDFYSNFDMAKAKDMLKRLEINEKDKLKTMSKGTKEKVQLITTMSRKVPLYILDEPIGGVDPAARDYILSTILSNYQDDATIIISTHLITDIESILNHVIFLKKGHIVRQGNAEEIRAAEGKTIDGLFREVFKC
ncbi:MAG: ABC transporter ATP-binding protein [Treponema sp.]|nr:ABC transporter ATP-binding protein [Treponema sp.]MDD7769200.1 ABC transporter ATP-binding protein [Treponema sp.]MDY3130419.1 ABC transporter ATP-binding protein [Treponema sp.]